MNDLSEQQTTGSKLSAVGMVLAAISGAFALWMFLGAVLLPDRSLKGEFLPQIAAPDAGVMFRAVAATRLTFVRGDLWAMRARLSASPVFSPAGSGTGEDFLEPGRAAEKAVKLAPMDSGSWLILAGVAARQGASAKALERLRMSYYTGPNERALIDIRMRLAMQLSAFDDLDLADAIRREMRAVLREVPELRGAIVAAHRESATRGRLFIESAIAGFDDRFLGSLKGR